MWIPSVCVANLSRSTSDFWNSLSSLDLIWDIAYLSICHESEVIFRGVFLIHQN